MAIVTSDLRSNGNEHKQWQKLGTGEVNLMTLGKNDVGTGSTGRRRTTRKWTWSVVNL